MQLEVRMVIALGEQKSTKEASVIRRIYFLFWVLVIEAC